MKIEKPTSQMVKLCRFCPEEITMDTFHLPDATQIGYAHFYTADMERALGFYHELVGFPVISRENGQAALSANGKTPHILLTEKRGAQPKPRRTTGLYHVAIRLPNRLELSRLFRRMVIQRYPFGGFSDHLVSEALYLDDVDGNGLELYRDRPRSEWRQQNGQVVMDTLPLDLDDLLAESNDAPEWRGISPQTDIGHVHLHVSDLQRAKALYGDVLGLDVAFDMSQHGALFMSAGGYHHHLGLNTWAGSAPQPPNTLGLKSFTLAVPELEAWEAVQSRVKEAGIPYEQEGENGFSLNDSDNNTVIVACTA
jgi:catechol 2,3-dioxygenase